MKNENGAGRALFEERKNGKQGIREMEEMRMEEKRVASFSWDFSDGRIRRDRVRIYVLLERRRKTEYWWKEYAREQCRDTL